MEPGSNEMKRQGRYPEYTVLPREPNEFWGHGVL